MIDLELSFSLPTPWNGKTFALRRVGSVNFLVGPNGSGKSRFAHQLAVHLPNTRLLGTDRLSGMEQFRPLKNYFGDPFETGFAKNHFSAFKQGGLQGSGLDTIVLLEERMDLRIQIEATLGHLFDREVVLEWDSGNLIPKVRRRDSISYRLDREECHGIKELLVLLTHLYNDTHPYLIIDEPELNLHPQYQAFFMQEVRKFAGDPATDKKKVVFLVTHSPFILDFRSEDDVNSVISFGMDHATPVQISNINLPAPVRPFSLARRLNAHHKQFFFSDNPIFVEGILDARLIQAMLDASGVSVAGAGSCIIDAGGCEEVNHYLELCKGLGKNAHFLYDLDSLFGGNLRACIKNDKSIESFLASAGLGNDFAKYCGELDRKLTVLIDKLLNEPVHSRLASLVDFLKGLGERTYWSKAEWAKARTAAVTATSLHRADMVLVSSEATVADIEGHLGQIARALADRNIHLLSGGTIERYLPAYSGDDYTLTEDAKRRAVLAEMEELAKPWGEAKLSDRYGDLYVAVSSLPSKTDVDVEPALRKYLGTYIYELQSTVTDKPGLATRSGASTPERRPITHG